MLVDGLSLVGAPAKTLAWQRDVAQAFHRVLGNEILSWELRVRGVQRRARYTEAFTVEKAVLGSGSDYSVD
jgi:hypothetical protein